ncbi:MAG: serine/threonine protein kinase [Myxococcales bacterium]|nr:serine/threonine protein kinase [Myxococcales bacterium]
MPEAQADTGESTDSAWPSEPGDAAGAASLVAPPPPRIGRYAVLRTIGAGGMGVVYAAFDEELGRRVAIKVLHTSLSEDVEQRARILREAQAMAKMSHPNVAAIHEVGAVGRRLFVVMEFVDGPTLGAWLRAERRLERDILEVYMQAGRGLAAAHAAGLVHRDFKPDNALVGSDGRVRVVDFGLARERPPDLSAATSGASKPQAGASGPGRAQAGASDSGLTSLLPGASDSNLLGRPLTRPGALSGTPAYMSPEQAGSASFDERSDQYAFCVALWEALLGERPFAGDTVTALMQSVHSGQFQVPHGDREVAPSVLAALRRGLAADPARRWPAMDALLAALATDPSLDPAGAPRSRRRFVGALVAVGFGCTTLAALAAESGERPSLANTLMPSLIVLTTMLALAAALRRSLLRNRYHRRVIAVFATSLTGASIGRGLGWLAGMSTAELLIVDLAVEAAVALMAGLFVARWFVYTLPLALGTALLAALLPTHAHTVAIVYFPLLTLVTVVLWSRAARARERA